MMIKIGNKTLICSRKREHQDYLWDNINMLRLEIIEDVLSYNRTNKIPVKDLKRKATLIKKYSKRLKLIST
jgi:hypothetical protein|tara:strand:+ start:237 stop:449 length:213 start_codon:yes stop_codon:yes gene_type:complete